MVTVHVGDIQLGLFASQSYIRRKGFPSGAGDMMDHDFVGYDRNEEMVREFNAVGFNIGRDFFPVRCDRICHDRRPLFIFPGFGYKYN
jgi:hypothetical protein